LSAIKFTFADIRGESVGKLVSVPVYISGETKKKGLRVKFKASCAACGLSKDFDVSGDPKQLYDFLVHAVNEVTVDDARPCVKKRNHRWTLRQEDPPQMYQIVYVRDTLEAETERATTNHNYTAYILGSAPDSKDVELEGIPFLNPKTDDVELLAMKAKPATASIDNFQLTGDELASLRQYFNRNETLAQFLELARKNNPRIARHESAKLASLLAWVSPCWIDVNGQLRPGTMRVLFFGDPRQGKGSIANYLHERLRLGKHAVGETSSRTGVTYTIDSERGIIVWGVMVEADRGLVVLEALHKFPSDDLATMRETLVKLKVEVRRQQSAIAWARTRIIADSNARTELGLYPFPCQAARNLPMWKDQVDLTRWDILIPFRSGEVDGDEVVKGQLQGKDDPEFLENLRKVILWAWSRRPEQIHYNAEALVEAPKAFKELLSAYSLPDIPFIHEDSLLTILRISAAFAALSFSTLDGVILQVKREHIQLAKEFVVSCLEALEVQEYKLAHGQANLTDEDRDAYHRLTDTSELAAKVVEALTGGPKQSGDLQAELGNDASSIRRACAELKARGIIDRTSAGYRLSKKGVQLYREFHATSATNATEKAGVT
jgi:hypothetical protein